MPSALLAALERTDDGKLAATLQVAGKSALQWQADLALDLGCDRIICVCGKNDPEIIRVQTAVESAGSEFHVVKSPHQVAALAPSSGDLIIMRDSLYVDKSAAASVIGADLSVASINVEHSEASVAPHRYERIDGAHVWAGLARIPSALGNRLTDFPPDNDAISLLLRLGLQAGIKPAEIEPSWLIDKEWAVVGANEEAAQIEAHLLDRAAAGFGRQSLTGTLALMIARKLNVAVNIHFSTILGVLGILALACALPIALLSTLPAAVVALALGSFLITAYSALTGFAAWLFDRPSGSYFIKSSEILRDILITVALVVPATDLAQAALPVFSVGLIRLAEHSAKSETLRTLWSDRPIQLLIIALFGYFGLFEAALIALGSGAMITCFTQRQPH